MEDSGNPLLDLTRNGSGVPRIWLLKVPRYIGNQWLKPECRQRHRDGTRNLGIITMDTSPDPKTRKQEMKMTYTLAADLATTPADNPPDAKRQKIMQPQQAKRAGGSTMMGGRSQSSAMQRSQAGAMQPLGAGRGGKNDTVPRDHAFKFQAKNDQLLAIMSKTKNIDPEYRMFEGHVIERAELKPPRTKEYDTFKLKQIYQSAQPTRTTKVTGRVVKALHKGPMEHERIIKKSKAPRLTKGELETAVFKLFQSHEYYTMKDVVDKTGQSMQTVKEVLEEVGVYVNKPGGPRNVWALKDDFKR